MEISAMPLLPGKKNIGHNIAVEQAAGKHHKQAVAIALNKAGEARKKRRKLSPIPVQGGQRKQINDMVKWAEKTRSRRTK